MSALRLNPPGQPPHFIDLGPAPRPARLRGGPIGHLCVPEPTVRYRSEDSRAAARVKRFRERHGGRRAA